MASLVNLFKIHCSRLSGRSAVAVFTKKAAHRRGLWTSLALLQWAAGRVIFFPINAPGMGRFKLFDLVGYS